MLIDIVYNQKREVETLLGKEYILRKNLSMGVDALRHHLIKVILGPRRAGKSVYCLEMLRGKDFAYVNFDNEELAKAGHEEIINAVETVYPQAKYFLFDEIQNLHNWEFLANTMERWRQNLILTGSNANLLSGELATHLTGRYIEISVWPFSFAEFLQTKKDKDKTTLLRQYLTTGGYPEVAVLDLNPVNFFPTLIEATIFKDIINRYKVKFGTEIYSMAKLLSASFTKQVSFTKMAKLLGFGDEHTVKRYFDYLCRAYLFLPLNLFHFKVARQIKESKKIYFPDTGMAQAFGFSVSPDFGKLTENAVFLGLVRQGFRPNWELFYYKTRNGKEVDFVLKKGLGISEMIQVCADFSDLQTQKREISALLEAEEELKCHDKKIIVWEKPKETLDLKGAKIITLEEFLNY